MPKRQWRIGWRHEGWSKETPTYFEEGMFDHFVDADKMRKELAVMGAFVGWHVFVDVVPSKAVKSLNKSIGEK